MLSFALTGTLACVLQILPNELTLAVSSPLERQHCPRRMAWVLCVARDPTLRLEIIERLHRGDEVRIEGHIEQRRRQIGELAFQFVAFIAERIERLPPPSEGDWS